MNLTSEFKKAKRYKTYAEAKKQSEIYNVIPNVIHNTNDDYVAVACFLNNRTYFVKQTATNNVA